MASNGKDKSVNMFLGGNRLIDSLPGRQRESVLARFERIDLPCGTVLCEAGEPFEFVYFPLTGSISLVNTVAGHPPFETESTGSEGMLGAALILGFNRATQRGITQTRCVALRMEAGRLQSALQDSPELLYVLQRYLHVVIKELLQTAACNRFHDVGKRLARGLLLAQDRTRTDHLDLTHLLLANMLGVQRGAVTIAAAKLRQNGLIRYRRGKISILDRQGLEAVSCECYQASAENYASILS